jgi:hypothetical protein
MACCCKIGRIFDAHSSPQADANRDYPIDDNKPNQHGKAPSFIIWTNYMAMLLMANMFFDDPSSTPSDIIPA